MFHISPNSFYIAYTRPKNKIAYYCLIFSSIFYLNTLAIILSKLLPSIVLGPKNPGSIHNYFVAIKKITSSCPET